MHDNRFIRIIRTELFRTEQSTTTKTRDVNRAGLGPKLERIFGPNSGPNFGAYK